MRRLIALLGLLIAAAPIRAAGVAAGALPAPAGGAEIVVLTVNGVINPVVVEYVKRGYLEAGRRGARAVVLKMNTPGGLEPSMREIVQVILASPLPTIGWVAPAGGRAASAGAFIMMACHAVAMAPGTTMGSAHPVSGQGQEIPKTMDAKITNDAAAFIRSLAERHGRNADWAEEAVRKSVAVNEHDAVKRRIAEAVASDVPGLIEAFDGKLVAGGDAPIRLRLAGATAVPLDMTWRERALHLLAHPELAYILMTIGVLGLIYELQSAGMGLAGFVGGLCLVLALIALSILPFSVGGLVLMALGAGLFLADLKLQTNGGLSVVGAVCLLMGSLLLFSPLEPFWKVSRLVIGTTVGLTCAFLGLLVWLGLKAQRTPAIMDASALAGAPGVAVTGLDPDGVVHAGGEDWSARSIGGRVARGAAVVVRKVEGLVLHVEPAEPEAPGRGRDRRPHRR